ncbi:MAG: hypothetical protein QXZ06_07505 [Candidatus Jordarchaeales archaeon]
MRSEWFDVLVDGANVVMHETDNAGRGKTETLKQVVSKLKDAELRFFVIFDKGITRKCDEPSYLRKLEKEGVGFTVPGGKEADAYLLFLAERAYDCYVLSRDRFADYEQIYPSIRKRRIVYNLNEGQLEFKPGLEEVKNRRAPPRRPAALNVECSIEQVRRFLVLVTKSKIAKLCSEELLIERKTKNERGRIHVEAEFKEVFKISEGRSGVLLVKANGIKCLDYKSKSGMTHLTWTPYKLNPTLGRLSGYASPRAIIMLIESDCIHIPLPMKEKRGSLTSLERACNGQPQAMLSTLRNA